MAIEFGQQLGHYIAPQIRLAAVHFYVVDVENIRQLLEQIVVIVGVERGVADFEAELVDIGRSRQIRQFEMRFESLRLQALSGVFEGNGTGPCSAILC